MSMKWPLQANEESSEALQALLAKIAEGDTDLAQSDHVGQQVLSNLWFRAEVRLQAVRLVGGNVADPLCDDIAQERRRQIEG